jgi:hypothetical protein
MNQDLRTLAEAIEDALLAPWYDREMLMRLPIESKLEADFIVACSPDAIIALLDGRDALKVAAQAGLNALMQLPNCDSVEDYGVAFEKAETTLRSMLEQKPSDPEVDFTVICFYDSDTSFTPPEQP